MRKVLVVDDDATVRQLLRDVLELEGYEVDVAVDGFAALRRVEAGRPDCVVLDVMMPGLDGHAVLQRIRSSDSGGALPVIMLTAAAEDSQACQAWNAGVDVFLAKPFDPSELLRCLDHLLAGTGSPLAG